MSSVCTVRGGLFVEPCDSLSNATEYGHPRGRQKGIYAWAMTSYTSGPTRTMFGAKSGNDIGKGKLFNFCPWCGTDISAPFAAQVADKPADQPAEGAL